MIGLYLLQVLSDSVLMDSYILHISQQDLWKKIDLEASTNSGCCHGNNKVSTLKKGIFVHPP